MEVTLGNLLQEGCVGRAPWFKLENGALPAGEWDTGWIAAPPGHSLP